jgi:hypothetical protein
MNRKLIPKFNRKDWPIPDNFLLELGRISTLWGNLEGYIDISIGKFAGFNNPGDPRPFILVKHSSIPQKLDILAALCESLIPQFPRLKTYPDTISKLKVAQQVRNKYLHNSIGPDPKTGKAVITIGSARGKVKTSIQHLSIIELENASVEINEALRSLHLLLTGIVIPPIWETKGT